MGEFPIQLPGRRLAFLLALLLGASAFAGPPKTCAPLPTPEVDCPMIRELGTVCSPWGRKNFKTDTPEQRAEAVQSIQSCGTELQNCACHMIGGANCDGILEAGAAAAASAPDQKGRTKIAVTKDGAALKLGPKDAAIVSGTVTAARASDPEDKLVAQYTLEYNERLSRLATSLAYSDAASRPVKPTHDEEDYEWARKLATEKEIADLKKADSDDLSMRWLVLREAIRSCGRVNHELQHYGAPELRDPDVAARLREELVCGFRLTDDLWKYRVRHRWPGCSCDTRLPNKKGFGGGSRGRFVDGVCVTSTDEYDRFADKPIDERMPRFLEKFIAILRQKMPGYDVAQVGIMSCGYERLETGDQVKDIASSREKALYMHHLSDHARGTACDLSGVTFRKKDGCEEIVFKAGQTQRSPTQFKDSLIAASGGRAKFEAMRKQAIVDGELDHHYAQLEKSLLEKGFSAKDAAGNEFKAGVVVRNALTEAGFLVYDPMINGPHRNHFHFEIPTDDYSPAEKYRRASGIR